MTLLRSNSLEEKTKRRRRFSFFRNRLSTSSALLTTGSTEVITPPSGTDSGYQSSPIDTHDMDESTNPSDSNSLPSSTPSFPTLSRSRSTNDSSPSTRLSLFMNVSRTPPPLYRVPEHNLPISQPETHEDGLPTYSSAVYPTGPTTYQFTRTSPFAMIVSEDFGTPHIEMLGKYHISVGVNVWMPHCTITTIRRGGSEDGQLVAELE